MLRERVARLLPRSRFGRGVTLIAGGTVLGQGLVVLAAPVLTRVYSAKDFGILAVYASLLTTISAAASLRYEAAIPLPKDDADARAVAAVAARALLIVTLIVGTVTIVFRRWIEDVTHAAGLGRYLWVLPIAVFAVGWYQIHLFWRIRHSQYKTVGAARMSQAVGQIAAQIGLGVAGAGGAGLLVGDLVGRGSAATFISVGAGKLQVRNVDRRAFRATATRWRRFPLLAAPSALLNSAGRHMTPFLLAVVYGPVVAGWFAVVQRVAGLPVTVVGDPVGQVYFSEVSEASRRGATVLRPLFVRTAWRLLAVGVVPFALVALVGPTVFPVVFGSAWARAGMYLQVLTPMYLAQFVVVPLTPTLAVTQRQDLQLVWDVLRSLAVLLLFVVAAKLGWSDLTTIAFFGMLMTLLYLVLAGICASAIRSPAAGTAEAIGGEAKLESAVVPMSREGGYE